MNRPLRSVLLAGLAAAALSAPASAGVKEGIAAYQRGDYAAAIAEWKPLADAGNADAQFNLAQAYKTGRGVPVDIPAATALYRKAAEQGHQQAQASVGLLMFQHGDQVGAMPWIEKAAANGDPRSQYILGTAKFNGDLAKKDWVRAYALMSRAASTGLPPAVSSLAQMEGFLTTDQRAQGAALAARMAAAAPPPIVPTELPPSRPARVAAREDVYFGPPAPATPAPAPATAKPAKPAAVVKPAAPKPAPAVKLAEATPAATVPKATEAPVSAWAKPSAPAKPAPAVKTAEAPAPAPAKTVAPKPAPVIKTAEAPAPAKPVAPKPAPAVKTAEAPATPAISSGGKWNVQLGAFSSLAVAKGEWEKLKDKPGLAGLTSFTMPVGALTRLRVGPLKDKATASNVCSAAKAVGRDCFIVAP